MWPASTLALGLWQGRETVQDAADTVPASVHVSSVSEAQ